MRQALSAVREEQGPDAVILSTRRIDDGIEVIAAIDYDEALMRQALGPLPQAPADEPAVAATPDAGDEHGDAPQAVQALLPPAASEAPAGAAPGAGAPGDDVGLAAMRAELTSLRTLLETQVSGLLWKNTVKRSPLRAQILRNL